ncbi:hypothetical protein [Gymnodinialimonas hymeniacidonis]|uniref:hypothetical protein n=1 Tax=Gymnodinialimonas hymeniacidonis TaxID=3126508 RepID=UPI0034C62139
MDEEQFLADATQALAASGIDLRQLITNGLDHHKPFSDEVFAPIAETYGFIPESFAMARLLLNVAAHLSKSEAKWAATDLPKVRQKLSTVQKHGRALQKALRDLDEEDLYAANQASIAMTHATNASLLEMIGETALEPSSTIAWNGQKAVLERPNTDPLDLDDVLASLDALDQAMEVSLRVAGKGKKGRRENATLDPLLTIALQVYENFTGKRCSLLWTEKNEPLSEAARFCVDVVEVFDTGTVPSRIVSSSAETRRKSYKVSSLEELPDFIRHYSERSR